MPATSLRMPAFHLPHVPGEMVVAEALDFPGAVTQGEEGKALPLPRDDVHGADADLIELVPLSVHAGTAPR